ncbi:MAG: T9SS type A sorting domain-containing protein [Vicingaceae bacterium]|nr:T9SS type A sorting domain-containing protein [Vicingaceae bacterium]
MKSILIIAISFSSIFSFGQTNLIPNPGFDNFASCPTNIHQAYLLDDWFYVPSHFGTPDLYATCGAAVVSVPTHTTGTQNPRSGTAYAGLVVYPSSSSPNYREYLQVKLTSPLVAGESYDVSAWVNLRDNILKTCDGFGFHLTTSIISNGSTSSAFSISPSLDNTTTIDNQADWVQIGGVYIATGGEEYLTIGNFRDDANTNHNFFFGSSYIFVEDVSVALATPLPVKLTYFDANCQNDNPKLSWVTSSEINNDYFTIEKSDDAVNFEAIATVEGNGNSSIINNYTWTDDSPINGTIYYRLKQTDFNGAFEYLGIRTVTCEQATDISIYPNPFENSFTVQLSDNTTYPITIEVIDYLGRKVYEQQVETTITEIELNNLPAGTYFIRTFNETTQVVERIVKTK